MPSTTSRPIERALPSMILVACSMSFAFRSFIFCSAISVSAERLMDPAETLPGSFEPVCGRVERLAEFHDVHAALTQRRADGRRGIGGARRHLQLDIAVDLLGHEWPPFSLLPRHFRTGAHGKRSSGPHKRPPALV